MLHLSFLFTVRTHSFCLQNFRLHLHNDNNITPIHLFEGKVTLPVQQTGLHSYQHTVMDLYQRVKGWSVGKHGRGLCIVTQGMLEDLGLSLAVMITCLEKIRKIQGLCAANVRREYWNHHNAERAQSRDTHPSTHTYFYTFILLMKL